MARSAFGLLVWLAICFGAALIGSTFTARSVGDWYAGLSKPAWTPPNSVFGPVWSLLYVMMAVAAWLVWRRHGLSASAAMTLFAVQLVLNVAWSALFFGLRMPGAAFAEILLLWCLLVATAVAFWRAVPAAGWLMLPYAAWVTFASALNLAIWRMNA
jgi:benzodiazapine receptor